MVKHVGIIRVDQDGGGHFIGIEAVEDAHMKRSGGRADQDVWARNGHGFEQSVKIVRDGLEGPRRRGGIAPAVACAIVPAGAGKLRDFSLYIDPGIAGGVSGALKYHRGIAIARAENVKGAAADVDRAAHLEVAHAVPPFGSLLVEHAGEDQYNDEEEILVKRPHHSDN